MNEEYLCQLDELNDESSESIFSFYDRVDELIEEKIETLITSSKDAQYLHGTHSWEVPEFFDEMFIEDILRDKEQRKSLTPIFHFYGPASGICVDNFSVFLHPSAETPRSDLRGKISAYCNRYN